MHTDTSSSVGETQRIFRLSRTPESGRSSPISARRCRLILIAATVACLLPFIAKPFNIDDPLFVWTAKQIVQHPADPYGFSIVWYDSAMPMSTVTKNPPLASYYGAVVGPWTHWSEVALHIAFLIPAVITVVATYELACEMTGLPLLAGALTLAAPAFLVSATSIMCDVPMLALWMLSILAWTKGLRSGKGVHLALGAILIAACALTKYFGACLIPLLFLYSILKRDRPRFWALYFLVPVLLLAGYQVWTKQVYGQGLLFDAAQYAHQKRSQLTPSMLGGFLVGLSFSGGCMLPILLLGPSLLRRFWIAGFGLAVPSAALIAWNVIGKFTYAADNTGIFVTLILFIAAGLFALAIAIQDLWSHRDADAALLCAWVLGTFIFASLLNWTVNARSVLPMVPAIAILIARGVDELKTSGATRRWFVVVPVAASLAVSLWLAAADTSLAYCARKTVEEVHRRTQSSDGKLFFSGHWGFQYYMQEFGAQPLDLTKNQLTAGDFVVQPGNNSNTFAFSSEQVASAEILEINANRWLAPFHHEIGAGFYSSNGFGPLPFAFGRVPAEKTLILRVQSQ